MKKIYGKTETMNTSGNMFCPGCMHSTFTKILTQVIDELKIADKIVFVQPIGCTNNSSPLIMVDQGCSLHGRAPAFATGVKRCSPESIVFTYQGDGDLTSIGAAEIIHAANRGENFCTFLINNCNYGMTGGQMSPTTMIGQKTSTTVDGRDPATTGYPLHMAEIISSIRAVAFSGRFALNNPANINKAKSAIKKAFQNQINGKGFSFVEILSNCPTNWGLSPVESLKFIEEKQMVEFPLGIFKDIDGEVKK